MSSNNKRGGSARRACGVALIVLSGAALAGWWAFIGLCAFGVIDFSPTDGQCVWLFFTAVATVAFPFIAGVLCAENA
jgi:hypothetical protein